MNESLGLGECRELEYFCWKNIKDGLSFKAIDLHGNCLGVAISGVCEKQAEGACCPQEDQDDLIYRKHEKFYRIIKLTGELDKRVNLFDRHPGLTRYAEGKVLSVDGRFRGIGIAGELIRRTLREIEGRGLPLMAIQCSSLFSAKVMIKLGFTKVGAIQYKDFYIDGQQAIAPKDPHREISAFVKWV